jgi:hypothetical protein
MAQSAGDFSRLVPRTKKDVRPGRSNNRGTCVLRNHQAMEGGIPA